MRLRHASSVNTFNPRVSQNSLRRRPLCSNSETRRDPSARLNLCLTAPFAFIPLLQHTAIANGRMWLPERVPSISILFYRLLGNDARWPEIHEDGTQSLRELVFGFTAESAPSGYRVALHEFGMKVAMYWFAKLLDSPFSRLLTRCDDCGTYFAYERTPSREIHGGIHCTECKQHGSAKRMQFTRERRTKELVGFAADFWRQWKPNSQHGPRSKWIADRVNRRTDQIGAKAGRNGESHFPRITGRWVTEHSEEIQERAEALLNAKS